MHPVLARIDPACHSQQACTPRVCALAEFAVVEITGADAVSFLQGQVTNDIAGAPVGQARLAGYCTAQGRLLATFVMWREPQTQAQDVPTVRAIVRADIAPALVKRLGMFVLRAKAKLAVVIGRRAQRAVFLKEPSASTLPFGSSILANATFLIKSQRLAHCPSRSSILTAAGYAPAGP